MDKKDKILLSDLRASINKHFIDKGWITVSDTYIHSALISDDALPKSMESYQWDLLKGDNGPTEINDNGEWSYRRIGPEPIVS